MYFLQIESNLRPYTNDDNYLGTERAVTSTGIIGVQHYKSFIHIDCVPLYPRLANMLVLVMGEKEQLIRRVPLQWICF